MAYPFYLGENLSSRAASLDFAGFASLVKRNIDVILNLPFEPATVKKLRVSSMISLVTRAVYRAGADPQKIQQLGVHCYSDLAKLSAGRRDEIKNLLVKFSERAVRLVPEKLKPHSSLLQRFFDEVAREDVSISVAGVDPCHLCRAVKAATGRTPSDYIRQAKLSRARELLVTSSVAQVALASGFAKVSAFIASFRKYYGETPGAFSRRMSLGGMPPKQFHNRV